MTFYRRLPSACSPNSPKVRTTRSTFSRNAFTVKRAKRTVRVSNVTVSSSPSTFRVRLTAWGCSSESTSIAFFAIAAWLAEAKGIRTVLGIDESSGILGASMPAEDSYMVCLG